MFPLWPFEGYDLFKWNKGVWVGCFGLGLAVFSLHSFEILPVGFLSLFGCIALILFELSMFWLYRRHKDKKRREEKAILADIVDEDTSGKEIMEGLSRKKVKKIRKVIMRRKKGNCKMKN